MTTTAQAHPSAEGTGLPIVIHPVEARLAPALFALAFLHLVAIAGLIHRAGPGATPLEIQLILWFLAILWPVFIAEALVGFARRLPEVPRSTAVLRVVAVVLFPPLRMGWINPATNRIWLPRTGWHPPGKPLLKLLDKIFGGPMLIFAFLILPLLLLEYLTPQWAQDVPGYAFALDLATAMIWVAFALEFVLKVSAAPRTAAYFRERWLDLAIVVLPTLQFVLTHWLDASPLARLLRLGRALAPEQIASLSRVYRLRGLMMKGWHAFLLLDVMARIIGITPARRLRLIEEQIGDLEAQITELKREAEELRAKTAVAQHEAQPST